MQESDDRKTRRSRIARAAAERLASGRAREVDEAVELAKRALRGEVRGGDRDLEPTRKELRAHAQALEESQVGAEGRRRRVAEALGEVISVLRALEPLAEVAGDGAPDGAPDEAPRPAPAAYGRAARGEFDLDPIAHLRVVTSARPGLIADHLERSGCVSTGSGGVDCHAIETRYGMMDELCFDGVGVGFRIVRIPPRMRVDPNLDLIRGRRVERAEIAALERLRARIEPRRE